MAAVRNEVKAGIFIVIALSFFVLSIFIMGRERQIFSRQIEYSATFKDVKGLSAGAPVRLGGISIGRVSEIHFSPNPLDPSINVTVLINSTFTERIRKDTSATIETQGLLGDRFLALSSGTSALELPQGGDITTVEVGDIGEVLTRANAIVQKTTDITKNIDEIVAKIKTESLNDIINTTKVLNRITEQVEKKDSLLHTIIYSDELGKDVRTFIDDLSAISHEVKTGDGIAHSLIYSSNKDSGNQALSNAATELSATLRTARDLLTEVKEGKGALHGLIYGKGSEELSATLRDLAKAASQIATVTNAISTGSGSLGAFIIDPSLYDNLVDVTEQAKRSLLLREAIQATIEK